MANYNFENILKKLEEKGFEAVQIVSKTSESMSCVILNGRVDQTEINEDSSVGFKALKNGKKGTYSLDTYDESFDEDIILALEDSCTFGKDYKKEYFTEGGLKYKRLKRYNKEIADLDLEYIKTLNKEWNLKISNSKKEIIKTVQTQIATTVTNFEVVSSTGLNYTNKKSVMDASFEITVGQGDKIESAYDFKSSLDVLTLNDLVNFSRKEIFLAVMSLNAQSIKSGEYKVLLGHQPTSVFIDSLVDHLDAKRIREHRSLLENCFTEEAVVSKKITITTDSSTLSPITSTIDSDFRPIPDKKYLVKAGVLQTKVYNNEEAALAETTSNALSGATLKMKAGTKSIDEAIASIKKGVYIKSITGLHASLDYDSLNFSSPCEAYFIKDGKIAHRISLCMVSGNIINALNNVSEVLSEVSDHYGNFTVPMIVKSLKLTVQE